MVGCTMFNTIFMCSEEEIVALITRHPVDILGLYYDTGSCHGETVFCCLTGFFMGITISALKKTSFLDQQRKLLYQE